MWFFFTFSNKIKIRNKRQLWLFWPPPASRTCREPCCGSPQLPRERRSISTLQMSKNDSSRWSERPKVTRHQEGLHLCQAWLAQRLRAFQHTRGLVTTACLLWSPSEEEEPQVLSTTLFFYNQDPHFLSKGCPRLNNAYVLSWVFPAPRVETPPLSWVQWRNIHCRPLWQKPWGFRASESPLPLARRSAQENQREVTELFID